MTTELQNQNEIALPKPFPNSVTADNLRKILKVAMEKNGKKILFSTAELQRTVVYAQNGIANYQFKLAIHWYHCDHKPQAAYWFRKAAEQGHAVAQNNLGVCYFKGQGVPQDYAQAVIWYNKSVEQGLADAQFNLGISYHSGLGVPKDYAQAVSWYRMAAEQGHADAQYNLGNMYANGEGLPKDYAKAVDWYRMAAEQGHAAAQSNLGIMYGMGQGVSTSYFNAYILLSLAALSGHGNSVKGRDFIQTKLMAKDLEEAQQLVSQWKVGTPLPLRSGVAGSA